MAKSEKRATLPDPAEWHSKQETAAHQNACWICSRPEARDWLRKVVEINKTAARPVTYLSIHRTLRDTLGYPYSIGALRNCAREHHAAKRQ